MGTTEELPRTEVTVEGKIKLIEEDGWVDRLDKTLIVDDPSDSLDETEGTTLVVDLTLFEGNETTPDDDMLMEGVYALEVTAFAVDEFDATILVESGTRVVDATTLAGELEDNILVVKALLEDDNTTDLDELDNTLVPSLVDDAAVVTTKLDDTVLVVAA